MLNIFCEFIDGFLSNFVCAFMLIESRNLGKDHYTLFFC